MSRHALLFVLSLLLLFSLGLAMVFNTTAAEVVDRSLEKSTYHALGKQALYALVGLTLAALIWFIGYQEILRLSGPLLLGFTILLVLVLVPGIGQKLNGARRWIGIGGYSFQPSEFVKYLIPLYLIRLFMRIEGEVSFRDLLQVLSRVLLPIGLILIEPDNGTVAIIFSAIAALLFLFKIRFVFWGAPLLILAVIGGFVAAQMPHVADRIEIYLHPEKDLLGKGHQPYQAKIAAGSGGLFGKGAAESLQKLDYLPEARSDYIAAIFAEEFGFAGMALLIATYMIVGYAGFRMAMGAFSQEGYFIAAIFTFLIVFQAFLNLGVVSGLLPSKGTNLPFFSHGGSSLLANLVIACLVLNVHVAGKEKEKGLRS